MAGLIWIVLLGPATLAALTIPSRRAPWSRATPPVAAALVLACGVAATVLVTADGPGTAAGGLLRMDALTAYLLSVVGAVAVTATWAWTTTRADGYFSTLMCLFLTAMTLALLADNLGSCGWRSKRRRSPPPSSSLSRWSPCRRAAWVRRLGSVGIAIAFLGSCWCIPRPADTLTLSWVALTGTVALDTDTARIGLALTVLGFATKAGLAPMHSWLPDAHSQAPAPVSGLMSGVLLSVAFYAILRVKAISDAALGPDLMRALLTAAGLLSIIVAAALIFTQRDYKRMLAYSSIEHMGLLALGAAVGGPLATGAVLLHILGHGLAKASMFVVAGRILSATRTSRIDQIGSLLRTHPSLARPWLAGMAALLGFPPFGLFLTEVAIIVAGFQRGMTITMSVALVALLLVFVGLARHTLSMTLGGPGREASDAPEFPSPTSTTVTATTVTSSTATSTTPSPTAAMSTAPSLTPDLTSGPRRAVTTVALTLVALLTLAAWPLHDVLEAAAATLGATR